MIGAHVVMAGDRVTVTHAVVARIDYPGPAIPDRSGYSLQYVDSDWPHSDVSFWHWLYNHFEDV